MWLRLRLDIGFGDLFRGLIGSLWPGRSETAQKKLENFWSRGQDDALATLSVRSGYDLLLQALKLPAGSEVLYSAITIADMPRLAKEHGLIPVPVDLEGTDFHLNVASLREAISPQSKVLVVAHLFGAIPDLTEVLQIAREHNLFVIEDCAQAWYDPLWRGHIEADASLFSFGTIKTATAAGGALCRIRDPELLAEMRDRQACYPTRSSAGFPRKMLQYGLLKMIAIRPCFSAILSVARLFGKDIDQLLGGMIRGGFAPEDLLTQLRHQPDKGTLRLLHYRLETYPSGRIQRRIAHACILIDRLNLRATHPELTTTKHTFWLFPYQSDRPEELMQCLREQGFDSTQRGRMKIVSSGRTNGEPTCPGAAAMLDRTLFLPVYPEMTDSAMDRMAAVIEEFERSVKSRAEPAE